MHKSPRWRGRSKEKQDALCSSFLGFPDPTRWSTLPKHQDCPEPPVKVLTGCYHLQKKRNVTKVTEDQETDRFRNILPFQAWMKNRISAHVNLDQEFIIMWRVYGKPSEAFKFSTFKILEINFKFKFSSLFSIGLDTVFVFLSVEIMILQFHNSFEWRLLDNILSIKHGCGSIIVWGWFFF